MEKETETTNKNIDTAVSRFAYLCNITGLDMTLGAIRQAHKTGELGKVKKLLDELEKDVKETKEAFEDYLLALQQKDEESINNVKEVK